MVVSRCRRRSPADGFLVPTGTAALLRALRLPSLRHFVRERLVERLRRPLLRYARHLGLESDPAETLAADVLCGFLGRHEEGRYDAASEEPRSRLHALAAAHPLAAGSPARLDRAVWDRIWAASLFDQSLEAARRDLPPESYRAFELVALRREEPDTVARILERPRTWVDATKEGVLTHVRETYEAFGS